MNKHMHRATSKTTTADPSEKKIKLSEYKGYMYPFFFEMGVTDNVLHGHSLYVPKNLQLLKFKFS